MVELTPDQEALKKKLHERIDLSFVEFLRFTRDVTVPEIKVVVDQLVAAAEPDSKMLRAHLSDEKKHIRVVWSGAGPMEITDEPDQASPSGDG